MIIEEPQKAAVISRLVRWLKASVFAGRSRDVRLFISYRRDDTLGHAGRLETDLRKCFGDGNVFKDMNSLRGGEAFEQRIQSEITMTNVLLAMIGPRFFTLQNAEGIRRIDEPGDLVRREIEVAFLANVRVIPVLVQGAPMPKESELPESIRQFSKLQAEEVSDLRWHYDVSRLCDTIAPRVDRRPAMAGSLLVLGAGVLAWWHLTGTSLPGTYRCESEGQILPNCSIEETAAGLFLSFYGPNHGQGGLIDTYSGLVNARHCGFTAALTNEFSASNGASSRSTSLLDVVCDNRTLKGTWTFGSTRREIELERVQ